MNQQSFTIVAAVNNAEVLRNNLLRSPELLGPHPHQLIFKENFPSASLAYNSAIEEARNDIIVFVHQDVYFPEGWLARLQQSLAVLDEGRTAWGVLGAFGSSRSVHGGVGTVHTTGLGHHGNKIIEPTQIETLDEIVLVLRKSRGLRFDSQLPHFHLYGADICLIAREMGLAGYAIPGFCVHNTNQLLQLPPEFYDCYRYMKRKWARKLPIYTSCMTISKFDKELRVRQACELGERLLGRRRLALRRVDDPRVYLG